MLSSTGLMAARACVGSVFDRVQIHPRGLMFFVVALRSQLFSVFIVWCVAFALLVRVVVVVVVVVPYRDSPSAHT